jgi:hypothetical protein
MRHAFEPDHLAAVTTLVSRERSSVRAALLGVCWGIGHTLALMLVGAAVLVFRSTMPAGADDVFEFVVGLMLVALGVRTIAQAARRGPVGPPSLHRHGRMVHWHAGATAHVHVGAWTLARGPLLVGIMHGLAGSGALTALVLTTLSTTSARLAYVLLFGMGSTLGMAVMSGLLGWPLARVGRHHAFARGVALAVGCFSTLLGVVWGYSPLLRLL